MQPLVDRNDACDERKSIKLLFVGRLRMSQQEEEHPRVLEMKRSQAA